MKLNVSTEVEMLEEKLNFQLVHKEEEGERSIFDLFEKEHLQTY